MQLLGLCFVLFVTLYNGVCTETITEDAQVGETGVKIKESGSTPGYPVPENATTLKEERSGLESLEQFFQDLLSPKDAAVQGKM